MTLAPYIACKGRIARRLAQFTQLIVTGLITRSVTAGLTASTTQTQAGGLALTTDLNVIATVANAGDAVTLPSLSPGQSCDVYNAGAHAMSVFPFASLDQIDGGSAAAAVTLTNPHRARFSCTAPSTITSAQLGAASA